MTVPRHILVANVFFAPYSYGGATVVAEQVARALHDRGAARISVISLISRAELAPYTMIRAQVAGIDNYLINVPASRSYEHFFDNPHIGKIVEDLIDDLAPDLMHLHCIQEIGVDILRVAKSSGLPVIVSVHDYWWICERQFMVRLDQTYCGQNPVRIDACRGCVGNWEAAKSRFNTLRQAAGQADIITYPSHFTRDLCESSGLAPGKGVVWENGVHMPGPDFSAAQAARRAQEYRLTFGFVGGPSQIKGWSLIRDAFKGLDRSDFRVHLVDGSLDGSWWRGHDFGDLPGDWEVVPRYSQRDMDRFYVGIDVLLFLSQWKETFGLTIREALARGITVIQTDSGGTTEHAAADRADLIPIGAGPEVLRYQLKVALESHPATIQPVPVTRFTDQAEAFEKLVDQLLDC